MSREAYLRTCENGLVSAKVSFLKFSSSWTLKSMHQFCYQWILKSNHVVGNCKCKPTWVGSSTNRHQPAQTTNTYSSVLKARRISCLLCCGSQETEFSIETCLSNLEFYSKQVLPPLTIVCNYFTKNISSHLSLFSR